MFGELAQQLPLPPGTATHLDKASVVRLTLSYLQLRALLDEAETPGWASTSAEIETQASAEGAGPGPGADGTSCVERVLGTALEGFLLLLSPSGQVVYISEGVSQHTGIPQMELIGQSVFEFIHPCDQEEIKDILNFRQETRGKAEKQDCDFFTRVKCTLTSQGRTVHLKSASWKVLHCTGVAKVPQVTINNLPGYLILLCQPVPLPSASDASVNRHAFLSRHSPDMKFTYCQPSVTELTGYSEGELLGRSVFQYCHAQDCRRILKAHHNLFSKGQMSTGRYRLLARRGGYVWAETDATVVCDERTGQPHSVLCVNYILSEPEESEVTFSLEQTESLFRPCPAHDTDALAPAPVPTPLLGPTQVPESRAQVRCGQGRGYMGSTGFAGESCFPAEYTETDPRDGGAKAAIVSLMERLLEWDSEGGLQKKNQENHNELDLDSLAPYIPMDGEDFKLSPIPEVAGDRGALGPGDGAELGPSPLPKSSWELPDSSYRGLAVPGEETPFAPPPVPRAQQRGSLQMSDIKDPSHLDPRQPQPHLMAAQPSERAECCCLGKRCTAEVAQEMRGWQSRHQKRHWREEQPGPLWSCNTQETWVLDGSAPLWKRMKVPGEVNLQSYITQGRRRDPWSLGRAACCGCVGPQASVPWAPGYTETAGGAPRLDTPFCSTDTPVKSTHRSDWSAGSVCPALPVLTRWECEVNAPLSTASSLLHGAEILRVLDQATSHLGPERLGTE
ncbi:hypoxia inducible factor 1 subunit alpha, like 2 isoform X2 [Amia ocellicauda]